MISPDQLENLSLDLDRGLTPPELEAALQNKGMEPREIVHCLSRLLQIPAVDDMEGAVPAPIFVEKIPFEVAKRYQAVALDTNPIQLAISTVVDYQVIDEISLLLEQPVHPIFAPTDAIMKVINEAYAQNTKTGELVLEEIKEVELDSLTKEISPDEDLMDMAHKAPIVKLVNSILFQALKQRASDIHLQPYENSLVVRYRIDGLLYKQMDIPKALQEAVISRIKVMGNMDIAERRLPQDGGTSLTASGRMVDVRISSLPSAHGERIVFRLQDKSSGLYEIEKIGLEQSQLDEIQRVIHYSHGIILVTGPTGSGKTTTLYASLKEINTPEKNIITIEDPVEYLLEGISQIQVAVKKGLTFANGLRSIVRQDPDVIMIGEIRDLETARIAIQSALTGHLVFSTLHTNDAPGAITRLLDIGIEPFLAASSLLAVIAQRLLRRVCPLCKRPYTPQEKDWIELQVDRETLEKSPLQDGRGCDACFETGYSGRTGIYEILPVDETVKRQILGQAASSTIKTTAVKEGRLQTLRHSAMKKLLQGETSVSEVLRVTQSVDV